MSVKKHTKQPKCECPPLSIHCFPLLPPATDHAQVLRAQNSEPAAVSEGGRRRRQQRRRVTQEVVQDIRLSWLRLDVANSVGQVLFSLHACGASRWVASVVRR